MVMTAQSDTPRVAGRTGVDEASRSPVVPAPATADAEMTGARRRRSFSLKDKLRILAETDAATGTGEIGAILRREGLYSSVLQRWRRQRDTGVLQALAPARRGPKPSPVSPETEENQRLRRENAQLKERLARAETIIDFQKKVSELLAIPLNLPSSDGNA